MDKKKPTKKQTKPIGKTKARAGTGTKSKVKSIPERYNELSGPDELGHPLMTDVKDVSTGKSFFPPYFIENKNKKCLKKLIQGYSHVAM